MAERPFERYLKDKEETEEIVPGERNSIDEIKESFQKGLTELSEPTKPVKFFKSFSLEKTEEGKIRDTSVLRFGIFLDPGLRIPMSVAAGEDIVKKLESEDEKDYISGLDEVRKGIESGAVDLVEGTGSLLFAGTDFAFDTDFQSAFEDFMKDKQPDRPETWRGELVGLLTQFAVPGTIIQKVISRIPKVAKIKNAIKTIKGPKKRATANLAVNILEGATVVGATDFIASEPDRQSIFFEPEDTEGLTGRKKAAAIFRNKIKYGQEGATVGGGFPIVGKAIALGFKYGITPATVTTARLGAKGVDNAVFKPIAYLGSTKLAKPVVTNVSKAIQGVTKYTLSNSARLVASGLGGKFIKQLPDFKEWRLYSVTSPNREEVGLKRLDNFLSYFRSYGKAPKDIEGITEKVALFVKSKSRKIDLTMQALERKAYALAKQFEKNYNKGDESPALQKYYLDGVEDFLRGQKKLNELPKELQALANDLKLNIKKVMEDFKSILPKGKKRSELVKSLEKIEVGRINSYLVKSFSTFTNPNYRPDESMMNKAVDWISKNVIKSELKKEAIKDFPNLTATEATERAARNLAEQILRIGKAELNNPLLQLKEIGKLINFKDYKILKTGEELPTVIKNLLGVEKNLKSSVSYTVSEMFSAAANKRAMDLIAESGLKNGWLFKSLSSARNNNVLDAQPITKVERIGDILKTELTTLYASPEYVQMFKGTGGVLDNLIMIPLYRIMMQGKVGVQIGKTLYSPQTQVRNVSSATLFAMMNGHIGGRASVTNSMKMVFDDVFGSGKQGIDEVKFNEYIEKMVRLGVYDENVIASELKGIVDQIRRNQINTTDKLFDKLIKMAPTDKVARLYAGGDNLWKGFGFEYSRSQLSTALKNLDDVKEWFRFMGQPFDDISITTGVKKTFDDALDEAAAYIIRNTYPTYSKVPPAIQALRKLPLGSFISFPAEILRTATNVMALGLKEASHSNPYIRQMGLRRLLGAASTNFVIGAGITETAQFVTNSTQSQWDAYKRSGAASWDSRSKLIAIKGWENGESAAINFSYFSPYDSLHAPFTAALAKAREQNLNPQETEKYVLDLMFAEDGPVMTFLEPFITEPIGYDRVIDVTVRNGKKDQGGSVYSASDDLGAKFAKSFAYVLDGVQPGATKSAEKISGSLSLDLTKGGKPLKLFDELLALFAGTRIIRIDVKNSLKYQAATMNSLLRAVDENENFYNVDNYANNTPNDMAATFKNMQDEAFRIQKDMFIRIKDFELLDLDEDVIRKILKDAGVSRKVRSNLMNGIFTPINYSKKRFETKVNTIEKELQRLDTENRSFKLNKDFVYPKEKLDEIKQNYTGKEFFEEDYDPEKYDYKLDKDGRILLDVEGNPVKKDKSILRSIIETVPPTIRQGLDFITNPLSVGSLPENPMPKVIQTTQAKDPNTNLTRTQQALLSPTEQVIAARKIT
tara:strand:- start:559 stop:4896 length:4338 start_codon:yes stop_codon:yes gene_type:complete